MVMHPHECPKPRFPPALTASAVVAFGFTLIHPIIGGNGRLHRFLLHHILAKTVFTPQGLIFPVSATMQNSAEDL